MPARGRAAAAITADFLPWLLSRLFHFELERRRFSLATAIGCNFFPEASRCFFNSEIGLPRRCPGNFLSRWVVAMPAKMRHCLPLVESFPLSLNPLPLSTSSLLPDGSIHPQLPARATHLQAAESRLVYE
jgi:hypothetical protein